MRVGLISDVHANLPALKAVMRSMDEQGVDQILVAGDLVGYGAQPNECVETLVHAGARSVAGNHDLFVMDRLPPTRFPALARRSAELARLLLTSDVREVLSSLPLRLQFADALVTHGSLDSPEEYVRQPSRARQLLERLPLEAAGVRTLVLGHTHHQWCVLGANPVHARGTVHLSGRRLLNPGSVGQSRQRERRPRARFAIYDVEAGSATFLAVNYDVAAASDALRRQGLPDRCLHAPPQLRSYVVRLVGSSLPEGLRGNLAGHHPRK
jgi:predicted phosphodiesterase